MRLLVALLALACGACHGHISHTYDDHGNRAFVVYCHQYPEQCLNRAGNKCTTTGYKVLSVNGKAAALHVDLSRAEVINTWFSDAVQGPYSMLFSCQRVGAGCSDIVRHAHFVMAHEPYYRQRPTYDQCLAWEQSTRDCVARASSYLTLRACFEPELAECALAVEIASYLAAGSEQPTMEQCASWTEEQRECMLHIVNADDMSACLASQTNKGGNQ